MTPDANSFAREHGYSALRREFDSAWGADIGPRGKSRREDDVSNRAQAQKLSIDRRYRERRRRHPPPRLAQLRKSELRKVLQKKFGSIVADTADGRNLCRAVAVHMARDLDAGRRIPSWMSLYAPWMTSEEVSSLVAAVTAVDDNGRFILPLPTADDLGRLLGISIDQRDTWGLCTIGAIDDSPAKRRARRKAKAREREARRRTHRGPRPTPKSTARPWEKFGVSRATWYRRGQPDPRT